MPDSIILKVNGREENVRLKPYDTLSRVLREELGMTGTKRGCDYGGCGACTVSIDGRAVYSCMFPAQYAEGREILTVEGLAAMNGVDGDTLSVIQESFLVNGGLQCGYCTSGIMISTKCLLDKNQDPSLNDIQEALAGNICRCTGYGRILESIFAAAKSLRQEKAGAPIPK
jgi:aerobic carbon-monoxide dehydrogenase small subunit